MWFTFVTARLFIFLSFQPRLAATLLRSCSVVNNPTRRVGLSPTFMPASPAQALLPPVKVFRGSLERKHPVRSGKLHKFTFALPGFYVTFCHCNCILKNQWHGRTEF